MTTPGSSQPVSGRSNLAAIDDAERMLNWTCDPIPTALPVG
ncbi:hypothetical protein AB0M45_32905 [Nocardia sp. NPDC051787]